LSSIDKKLKNIAQGATGVVSLITHLVTGLIVVWKQIPVIDKTEEEMMHELEIAKTVESPFTVKILDYFFDDDSLFMVMEYFKNGTLAKILEEAKAAKKYVEEKVCISIFLLKLFRLSSPYCCRTW
jgi:serine/threonine protein kinase